MTTIQVVREELLMPLQQCLSIAEKKGTLPILSYVLLNFSENTVSITASDTELQLTIVATLQQCNPNVCITLPGHKLLDICKGLSENTLLSISLDNEKASIVAGKNKFTLLSLPAKDYPLFDDLATTMEYRISKADLHYLLSKTVFAMAEQDMRYYLNGILFNFANNQLEVVATDSHRLALAVRPLSTETQQDKRILVPKHAINELLRIMSHYDAEWVLGFNEQQITFSCQHLTLISKLINEQTIDFKKLIPRNGNKDMVVGVSAFKQALSLAAILSHEKSRGVRLQLAQNHLSITAHNPEYEAAETELDVEFPFDNFTVSFNVAYLLDIIAVTDQENLRFSFTDANGGVLVQPEGASDCLFVVMPLRI